jgi:hypothetical protein
MVLGLIFAFAAVLFGAIAALCGGIAWLLLWPAASAAVVSLGYLALGARVLGKRSDGGFPPWAKALHTPYFLFSEGFFRGYRAGHRDEETRTEICPGLFVGGRPAGHEAVVLAQTAVLDLTTEFDGAELRRVAGAYRTLPMLDEAVPSFSEFEAAMAWLEGLPRPWLIHCAFGHGRSVMVASGVLVRTGEAASHEEALAAIKARRPLVRLRARQLAFLREAEARGLLRRRPSQIA